MTGALVAPGRAPDVASSAGLSDPGDEQQDDYDEGDEDCGVHVVTSSGRVGNVHPDAVRDLTTSVGPRAPIA
ncbi:MAG TPA: hypothetical protein VGH99_16730 [Pseudonocardia sp.]